MDNIVVLNKKDLLKLAREARQSAIQGYQKPDPDLIDITAQLRDPLYSYIMERTGRERLRDVIWQSDVDTMAQDINNINTDPCSDIDCYITEVIAHYAMELLEESDHPQP